MNSNKPRQWVIYITLVTALAGYSEAPSVAAQSPADAVKSGYLDVDGGKIYYEQAGHGPDVVLIHDGLLHSAVWDAQFSDLSKDHRVVRYDRRGYGRSMPEPTQLYDNVEDLDALLRTLHVEHAVVVGSSAGGGLAIEYTLAHPDRVTAVVLSGAVVDGLGYTTHFMRRAYENFDQDIGVTIDRWVNERYTVAPGNTAARERMKQLLTEYPHDLSFGKHRFVKLSSTPALRRLSEITVPTLILVGSEDIADVHAHAGAIEAGIVGSVRKIIPGAGHLSYMERPEIFNHEIREFFSLISLQLEHRLAKDASRASAPLTRGFAPVDSTYLYYETLGKGPALVMAHGGGIDHRMWDDQFAEFAKHYRVIRYDAEGHGLSKFGSPLHKPHDDLRDLLDHLGIERAHVMGLSMGGRIVIDFAVEHPQMVSTLIAVGPGLSGYDFNSAAVNTFFGEFISHLRAGHTEPAVEAFMKYWTIGPNRSAEDVDPGVRARVKNMLLEGLQPGRSQGEGQVPDPPAIGRLSEITAPTLVIIGKEDMPDILDIGNKLQADVDGAKLVLIPDAAHMVNMERPQQFNRTVLEFLARH